jgi:fumarate hydratase class II
VAACGRDGQFELNVTMPLMAHCLLEAVHCLATGTKTFAERCIAGLEADPARCRELVDRSLMLVTALNPHIGYDNAAKIAKKAHKEGTTLKEAALALGLLTAEQFDAWVDAKKMTEPGE